MTYYGTPVQVPIRSLTSTLLVPLTDGFAANLPPTNLAGGASPQAVNYIIRDGAIEMRPTLSYMSGSQTPFGNSPILGGMQVTDVAGATTPLISGTTRLATWGGTSWSVLSYVSAAGINTQPLSNATDHWSMTQIYFGLRDQNIAVMATGSYQSLYCWQSGTTVFSTLTGAPQARYVAAFDNYLLAFNMRDEGGTVEAPQRLRWNDRGSASSWTGGLSGFEDLLAAKGQGTGVMGQENRILVFFEQEIWQGYPNPFPFTFRFQPLDTSVGAPYPYTITNTPLGVIFLGRDRMLYLLPKQGGPALAIGKAVQRYLRDRIDTPERSWSVYDDTTGNLFLFYPALGGTGAPTEAVALNLTGDQPGWMPETFGAHGVTWAFPATLASHATTWAEAVGLWSDAVGAWAAQSAVAGNRTMIAGSSNGSIYLFDSSTTNDVGQPVNANWQSGVISDQPDRSKTVTMVRLDYQADSASSVTVGISTNVGQNFSQQLGVNLPAATFEGSATAYPYISAQYPVVQISSTDKRYRLFRLWCEQQIGGRP